MKKVILRVLLTVFVVAATIWAGCAPAQTPASSTTSKADGGPSGEAGQTAYLLKVTEAVKTLGSLSLGSFL